MRFMMLMIPRDIEKASPNAVPDAKTVEAMSKYNEACARPACSWRSMAPSAFQGRARDLSGGKPKVTDGPSRRQRRRRGYWMIDVKSKDEAIEWAKRIPGGDDAVVEVRQVFEMEDFPPEVRKAAGNEAALRAQLERRPNS